MYPKLNPPRIHLFDSTIEDAWVNYNHKKLLEKITSVIDTSTVKSMIDAGCGNGLLFLQLKNEIQNCEMFAGFDLFEDYLLKNIKLQGLQFFLASGERISVKDETFDLVLCKDVLHHAEEPTMIISELARISSRYVIIIEANKLNPVMELSKKEHHHYTKKQVRDLLNELGHDSRYNCDIGTCTAYPFYLPITRGVILIREIPFHLVNITMIVTFRFLKLRFLTKIILSFLCTIIKEPSFNIIILKKGEHRVPKEFA